MTAADEPAAPAPQKEAVRGKSLREITGNALIQQMIAAAVLVNANGDYTAVHLTVKPLGSERSGKARDDKE